MKKVFPAIYSLWSAVLVFFSIVSLYSYYSVRATFGRVPGNDSLYELAARTHKPIITFPVEAGWVLIYFYLASICLIPFFLLINYIASRRNRNIPFEWKSGLVLIGIWLVILLLMNLKAQGWYMQYVLD